VGFFNPWVKDLSDECPFCMAGLVEKFARGAFVWQGGKSLGLRSWEGVLKIPIHFYVRKKSAGGVLFAPFIFSRLR
jgi:hypothetical protein